MTFTDKLLDSLPVDKLKIFEEFNNQVKKEKIKGIENIPQDQIEYYYRKGIILNILMHNKFDVQKSITAWVGATEWLVANKAHLVTHKSVENELRAPSAFFYERDKKGQPALIIKVKTRIPGKIDIKETELFFIYLLNEWFKYSEESPTGKCVLLWDREGFTKKNHDPNIAELMKRISSHLQNCMMQRLDTLFILHPNWFFRMLFSLFKFLISQDLKEKIKMVAEIKKMEKYFDKDKLMIVHGGQSMYEFDYETEFGENNHNSINEFYKIKNVGNKQQQQQKQLYVDTSIQNIMEKQTSYKEGQVSPLHPKINNINITKYKKQKKRHYYCKHNSAELDNDNNKKQNSQYQNDYFMSDEDNYEDEIDIPNEFHQNHDQKVNMRYRSLSIQDYERDQKQFLIQKLQNQYQKTYNDNNKNNNISLYQLHPINAKVQV